MSDREDDSRSPLLEVLFSESENSKCFSRSLQDNIVAILLDCVSCHLDVCGIGQLPFSPIAEILSITLVRRRSTTYIARRTESRSRMQKRVLKIKSKMERGRGQQI